MADKLSYAHELRALGQLLEALDVEGFSVQADLEGYRVTGQRRGQSPANDSAGKGLWQRLLGSAKPAGGQRQPLENVELRYTSAELARVDIESQTKRSATPGSSEAHSLSQILRAVGAFVEQKQGRFLRVSKSGQDIAIEYESAAKRNVVDNFTISALYDFWVKLYLRRRDRG